MQKRKTIIAAMAMVLAAPAALATGDHDHEEHGHFDIAPGTDNGKITSNGYSDAEQELLPGERVFGYELGEGAPDITDTLGGFVNDPGMNAENTNWNLSTDGIPGLRLIGPLTVWVDEATGYVPVADPAVFLRFNFGPPIPASNRDIYGTSAGAFADLFISSLHQHYNVTIGDDSGDRLDNVTDPPVGIYQVEAQIVSTSGTLTPSDTIWLNFNYWDDEEEHGHALEYTETVLAPEPGSALMLLGGAGLLAARRRSK